jgi:putative nucleotidyltransferase with HDIG domain
MTVFTGWLTGIAGALSSDRGNRRRSLESASIGSASQVVGLLVAGTVLWGTKWHTGVVGMGIGSMMPIRLVLGYGLYLVCRSAVISIGTWLRDGGRIPKIWKERLARKKVATWLAPIIAYIITLAYLSGGGLLIAALITLVVARMLTVHDRSQTNTSFARLVDALRFVRVGDMTQLSGETEREIALATALGRKMKLPKRNMDLLERATSLHNVGYIAADRRTVLKPTQLNPDEIEALKQHPYHGMTILRPVDGMEGIGEIICRHHESPDGTGYPSGLSGSEIPIESAIIKVVEAFVAMTSPRLYRKQALSQDTALDQIAEATGTCFDPIVAYFLFARMGRSDLVSRTVNEFGLPDREAIEARLSGPVVERSKVLLPREKKRAMVWGLCLTGIAFTAIFALTRIGWAQYLGLPADPVTTSPPTGAVLLALLALSALRPIRLTWGASLTWAPAVVLIMALAGGPVYASIAGLGFIGWSMLINPSNALSAGGCSTGRGDLAVRNLLPLTRRKKRRSDPEPAVAYGLMLVSAGSGAWLAYRLIESTSSITGLAWLPAHILSFSLTVGCFYVIETTLQAVILRNAELSSWRLWQRDYLKIFPEPLSYAALGYLAFVGMEFFNIWGPFLIFLLPAVWRHYLLKEQLGFQRVSDSLIRAIARTVDEKDLYTNGHSANVAEIAAEIAREMGKGESFVERIEDAAIRHDLGKVSWPNQVLRKPTSFDDDEQEVYKWTHPDVGAEIAALSGSPPDITELIRCHHEHFDGGGYLRGLSGSEIPLGARILALADAFDAMIHDRSHRERLSISEAIGEIRFRAGTQLDPAIVDAFLRVLGRIDLEELALRVRLDMIERSHSMMASRRP